MVETSTDTAWADILERFVEWAQNREDITAAIVVGSQAREDHPSDEWSDLDIVIVTANPGYYVSTSDWVKRFGNPWITFIEPTAAGGAKERRVLFEPGRDVDFAIIPRAQMEASLDGFSEVASRGIRVLVDKEKLAERALRLVTTSNANSARTPTDPDFLNLVNDFWYHTVWTAKKLRRGELWTAKACCDSYMKRLLLRMIEWHAQSIHGVEYDTWHSGRFLEEWVDTRIKDGLRKSFAHYDETDVKMALLNTMELFRTIARETALRLRFEYPTIGEEHASMLVRDYFSDFA